ncbi:flagellin [Teredinibacter turnerae]|uniref:flagellin N-terminal helical domain-containing protein n=1 Tax=Teredinibacter turnerae TaxID=2426 RepID=UPI00048E4172|nr:flagellin [Teredinibacter turnerae]
MPLVINTNVAALNSQRQLVKSGNDMSQAMERLASGKRINNARDDAAGLAISNRQTSQIRGLDQAIRNANDGVSLIQTAEGALDEVTNILQRMRELSIQSANGIYSDLDRSTLDAEVQQLKEEVDRIASSTTFNGQPLLDGSLSDVSLQVGSEAYQTIDLSIQGFSASALGNNSGDYVGEALTAATPAQALGLIQTIAANVLEVNDVAISSLTAATSVNDALEILNSDLDGKGAEVSTLVSVVADTAGNGVLPTGTNFSFSLVDGDGNSQDYIITDTSSMDDLVARINEGTAVTAKLNSDGKLVLTAENATQITITADQSSATGGIATTSFSWVFTDTSNENRGVKIEAGTAMTATIQEGLGLNMQDDNENWIGTAVTATAAINAGDLVVNDVAIGAIEAGSDAAAQVDLTIAAINELSNETGVVAYEVTTTQIGLRAADQSPIQIRYGDGAVNANVETITGFQEMNAAEGTGSIAGIEIDTARGAQAAIDIIDTALEQINSTRSDLGAINNRLDFTMSNLANISEKTSAARSRIVDADFASETSKLSRSQVLQQASQAMLAQANAQPQQVLQLLQG